MALKVRYVESVREIVDPVVEHLGRATGSSDLFETQHLIVPTAGMRAWLAPQVAARLGATGGANDGVMANVRVGYMGMLNALLRGGTEDDSDAWSIERVTMAVLRVIHGRDPEKDPFIRKHGGHLRAARAIADRFDRYAARRPQLIREWERAHAANEEVGRDNAQVEWQFALWRQVRDIIGVPSWPARTEEICAQLRAGRPVPGLPPRLMVAGVEALSVANLEILVALGAVIDVDVLVVHPSPWLRDTWSPVASAVPATPGVAPRRADEAHVVPGADMLVTTWLRGAFETQVLLASQGITVEAAASPAAVPARNDLLGRMQAAVASPDSVGSVDLAEGDRSVQIHRAHNLARQVEILRDALLHAFDSLPGLTPDQVVVLCADIEAAAPLLRATFDNPMRLPSGRTVQIPLVVADRSLRDESEGARLLADVLGLVGSRFDVTSVMRVATSTLVLRNLRLDQDDVDTWQRHVSTTRVRWGLDTSHRTAEGLAAEGITAHTWKEMLDRALLGALLPDAATPAHEIGGVVPLVQVDTADIDSLTGLAEVLSVLARLERTARDPRPVGKWCDELEEMLAGLCGESCTEIDDVLAVIQSFRDASVLVGPSGRSPVLEAVDFVEFADLLLQKVSGAPGHQPLRTGAVTATSFVPLRSVPFRVVCVVGLDDGTLPAGEAEGDDLVANDPVMGDPDPRVDTRRVLLGAFTAAADRFIVTCNGRSIKNNGPVPLVTPLAELLDFCGRLGVRVPDDPEKPSQIEHIHPRHASGRGNFDPFNGPVPGMVWSHDDAALGAARGMFTQPERQPRAVAVGPAMDETPLKNLETMLIDPLRYYLRETLRIFTGYEEDEPGAVLPVEIDEFGVARLAEALVDAERTAGGSARQAWVAAAEASDTLPVGVFGDAALQLAAGVADAVRERATALGVPAADPDPVEFKVRDSSGTTVDCHVPRVVEGPEGIVYSVLYHTRPDNELVRLSLRLLALRAAGRQVVKAVLVQRDQTKKMQMAHTIEIDPSVTQQTAAGRLAELARVEPIARVTPCPAFGDTGRAVAATGTFDDDSVLGAFDAFVDGRTYGSSAENTVFGSNPDPVSVYPPGSDELLRFFLAYGTVCTLVKDGGKENETQKWVLS